VISRTAEYALRVIAWLAGQAPSPHKTREIAQGTRVPAAYLSKVIQGLARSGLIDSRRGRNGGVTLAYPPDEITILEVVRAVDPPRRIRECPLGAGYHGKNLCPLHRRLDEAVESVERALGETTIAEILAEPSSSRPLLRPKRTRHRKASPRKRGSAKPTG
jgi:Rrf2 family nitric oxide-sensitive transcriptional repressor